MTTVPHSHPEVQKHALHPAVLSTVLIGGHAVKHAYNAGFSLIVPEIQRALGLSNTAIGFLNTSRNFAGAGSNLPAGYLSDRYSDRWGKILGLAMVVIGLGQFAMGFVSDYWAIVILAMVVGGTISFWHPPAMAALSHRFPDRRGFFISLHGSGGSIGEATGPLIVGGLLGIMVWQDILKLSLAPAVVTGIGVWFLMRKVGGYEQSNQSLRAYLGNLRPFLTDPGLMLIFLGVGGSNIAQSAMGTFLPIYLRNELNYGSIETGGFLFLGQVAGIVSAPIQGHLADRYGRWRVLVPSLLSLAIGILAISVAPPGLPLTLAILWSGAFIYPMQALFVATAIDRAGTSIQATTVSLVFGIGALFGSFSPTIAGMLADGFGVQSAFYWAAAGALASATVSIIAARQHRSGSTMVR